MGAGRFLINAMLVSGGYGWTFVPVEKRAEYMAGNIEPFSMFLGGLMAANLPT
jgi:hypothetical protein